MFRDRTTIALTCLALLGAPGCDKAKQIIGTASSGQTEEPVSEQSEQEADAALSDKLGQYIGCLNYVSRQLNDSRSRYLQTFDEEKGPTGKEKYGYINTVNATSCFDAIDRAKRAKPSLPEVEAAADAYRDSIKKLEPVLKKVHDYLDQKDFKDDNWAMGKELHPKLMAAYEVFDKASEAFSSKVTKLNEEVGARQLERLSKTPARRLEYLVALSVADGKKLVQLMDVEKMADLDGDALGKALAAYEKSYEDLDAYQSGHQQEADKVMMLSSFVSRGSDLLKAGKELVRAKRDKKEFDNSMGPLEHRAGHPANVIYSYNQLIDASNSLTFRY